LPRTRPVKLFKNGASQAGRLPAEFRLEGSEIYATRDEATGDVSGISAASRRRSFYEIGWRTGSRNKKSFCFFFQKEALACFRCLSPSIQCPA
jgi:hypothetical protein